MIVTFTGTWYDYYIITRHLVLLDFCTPELLCSWTPVIGRLLTLCSWYYIPVDPRNWIIMDIGLLWTPCGHYHWTISKNWTTYIGMGKLMNTDIVSMLISYYSVARPYTWIWPGGHQVLPWGVLASLLPCLPAGCAISPWVYSCGSDDTRLLFGHILSPTGI